MEPAGGSLLAALFVAGLASGVHCVGMCGGIVAAFGTQRIIPIVAARAPRAADIARLLAFNGGRLSSYALAGALAGLAGGAAAYLAKAMPIQALLYAVANVMLVLVGLYLMGAGRLLARLEALGAPLWRRLQPWAARGLSARSLPGAYAGGLAWGWLPCGLVYAALAAAAFAASPFEGALAMLAFGLGTLPNLLAAGFFAVQLRRWSARRAVRVAAGAVVLGFGAFGLVHASGIAESVQRGLPWL
ncbi:MAG: sulfite exporter TauE/SafE family protein [Betaproteobacteria bacterium]|nr:MAG: sulfite exporter TauE/SafE family protein [Betaproteobacteria bacterium]